MGTGLPVQSATSVCVCSVSEVCYSVSEVCYSAAPVSPHSAASLAGEQVADWLQLPPPAIISSGWCWSVVKTHDSEEGFSCVSLCSLCSVGGSRRFGQFS